ncbi:MAG TPA: prepilin-type N-terminal cleavage/methylation domain-containing protein [Planctomycetota bacterium]|nr:prepilin-type N-terminal cleavage/methylation domain-containing protein [Planctomycetota bacterium]
MSHPRTMQAGFTLLEVMMSVGLLAVGLSGVFGALGTAHQTSSRATNADTALRAMQLKIEELGACTLSNTDGIAPSGDGRYYAVAGLGAPTGRTDVMRIWLVRQDPPAPASATKKEIALECQWLDQNGPSTMRMTYFASNRTQATLP